MSTYPLSKTGARQLAAAEEAIERGLSTFMEVGSALATIRDGRLYREEYGTFEDYCKGRWGFSSRRARQLIDAVEIGTVVPLSNEAQARALGGLTPDEAIEVHGEAEKRGDTTAAGLARVKAERKPATQTHRTTETTTVTFDPETGEIVSADADQSPEGVAPPADQHPAVEGRGATQATPSVPPTLVCPTCGGTGEVQAVAS